MFPPPPPHGKTRQPLQDQGLHIVEVLRSHSDTSQIDRTTLDEGLVRRRDLYLTTHSTQKRNTSMSPAGFEPEIPASERPQTHFFDRADTGMGPHEYTLTKCHNFLNYLKLVRNLVKLIRRHFRHFKFTNRRNCHFVRAL
jgi:hypothetical protein